MTDELTIPPLPSEVADAEFRAAVAKLMEDPATAAMMAYTRDQNEASWFNISVNPLWSCSFRPLLNPRLGWF